MRANTTAAVVVGTVIALLLSTVGTALATAPMPAAGTLTQTEVTGFELRVAGSNVIIEQTTRGVMSGTLSGTVEDTVRVIIHSDGTFEASGTTICACFLDGNQGQVELAITDTGEQTSPNTSRFTGRAAITRATGDLSGLAGRLDIEGTVDLATGLSTIGYSGEIHPHP